MPRLQKSDNHASRPSIATIEGLEARQFFSAAAPAVAPLQTASPTALVTPRALTPKISVLKSIVYFNDPKGGVKSPNISVSIKNTGTAPLKITGVSLSGTHAAQFVIVSKPGGGTLPFTLAVGATTSMTVAFNPPSSTTIGVKTASLNIFSNDPLKPTSTVALRSLATLGTGGQLEPSLQRILDLYQIGVRTGDTNPDTTYLFSNTEARGVNDEVTAQLLKKAATGSVTIQPLATFAGGSPAAVVGWYPSGSPGTKHQLLTVSSTTAQSVNPFVGGTNTFDPGTSSFGLYTQFPFLSTTQYSQDSLNTAELTIKRKIRFFPLKQGGVVVANAYVFTTEDYNNDVKGGTDSNDFVGIIRNVKIA